MDVQYNKGVRVIVGKRAPPNQSWGHYQVIRTNDPIKNMFPGQFVWVKQLKYLNLYKNLYIKQCRLSK